MKIFVQIICLVSCIYGINGVKRYWIKNSNVMNKDNWENDDKHCKGMVFPEVTFGSMLLDNMTINQIVLPVEGDLYINNNAEMIFDMQDEKCIKIKQQSETHILDPRNWNHLPNKAIPDTHRIPCDFDDVTLPANSTFDVRTDYQLLVKSAKFEDDSINKFTSLPDIFELSSMCVGLTEYNCPCRTYLHTVVMMPEICSYVESYKKDADVCESPFKAGINFCTKICGAYIQFNPVAKIPKKLLELLEKNSDYIDFYISKSENIVDVHTNLFIVDKHTDDGFYSVGIAKEVYELLKSENVSELKMITSGKPIRTMQMLKDTFGMLFWAFLVTIVFFAIIFVVYVGFPQKYTSKIRWLPTTKYSLRPFMFARFENREEGGLSFDRSIAGSVVSLEKSFQNPLYGAIPSTSKDYTEFGDDIAQTLEGAEMRDLDASPLMIIEDLDEEEED